MSIVLDVTKFDVVGDGITDNSVALKHLRELIKNGPDERYILEFPSGHYAWSDNTWWLFRNRFVEINGNGSSFECISAHSWSRSFTHIAKHSFLEFWQDGPFNQADAVYPSGYLFRSANRGDRVVRLIDNVTIPRGTSVLLAGYVQQLDANGNGAGWPPNLRHYQYVRVSFQRDRDVVLSEPLADDYDEEWLDLAHSPLGSPLFYGKPRLFLTSLPEYEPVRFLKINDIQWLSNRNKTGPQQTSFSGHHIVLSNCQTGDNVLMSPTQGQQFEFLNCNFLGLELDKLIERVYIKDCVIGLLSSSGGGVKDLEVVNSILNEVRYNPRKSKFVNCQVNIPGFSLNRFVDAAKLPFTISCST